jgi:hypothetical protein
MGVETEPLHTSALACLTLLRELGPDRTGEFDGSLIPTIIVDVAH